MVFQPKLSLKYYGYMLHLLNALATFSSVNLNNPKNTIEERLICKKKKKQVLKPTNHASICFKFTTDGLFQRSYRRGARYKNVARKWRLQ